MEMVTKSEANHDNANDTCTVKNFECAVIRKGTEVQGETPTIN